jgi:serine/threonine-protein kinase
LNCWAAAGWARCGARCDTAIDRVVALKMLLPHFAQDPDFEKRFRREARAAARLDDPHVVPIHDVGEIDGRLYVTMRLINGVDLQTMLNGGPLEPDRAVYIVEQIASALNSAHQVGLVHRDVKPSNILVAHNDFAYLIDFGIARAADDTGLTSAGAAIGTWAYMAPERFSPADIEPSSDVYALACVLYQCLTGETPFPGSALEQIAVGHMIAPPPKPSEQRDTIPTALDQVIATGLAKQPTDRYPSAVEMATAAREAITDPTSRPQVPRPTAQALASSATPSNVAPTDPTLSRAQPGTRGVSPTEAPQSDPAAPAPGPAPSFWKQPRRRPGLLVAALAAVILLVAGGVFAVLRFSQHHNPASAAPTTIPFTGVYKADFGAITHMDGKPEPGDQPSTSTWGVRSLCRADGCVATASRPDRCELDGGGPCVRPDRWALGGRRPLLGTVRRRHRRILGGLHAATASRRHAQRRVHPENHQGLRRKIDDDLHPYQGRGPRRPNRSGHPTAADGVAGRSAARPLPRGDDLLDRATVR